MISAMSRRLFWAIECVDTDEAEALLEHAPEGSHIETRGELVILWVLITDDLIETMLSGSS